MANNEVTLRRADTGSELLLTEKSIAGLTTKLNGIVNSVSDAKKVANAAESLSKTLQSTVAAIQDVLNITYDGGGGMVSVIEELTHQDTTLSEAIETLRSTLNGTIEELKTQLGDADNALQSLQNNLQAVSDLTDSVNETAASLQSQIGNPLNPSEDSIYGKINAAQEGISSANANLAETNGHLGEVEDMANQAINDISSITIRNLFKFSKEKHKFSRISVIRAKIIDEIDKTYALGYTDEDILSSTEKVYPGDALYVIPESILAGYSLKYPYNITLPYTSSTSVSESKLSLKYIVPESPHKTTLPVSYEKSENYLADEYLNHSTLELVKKEGTKKIDFSSNSKVTIDGVEKIIKSTNVLPGELYYGLVRQRVARPARSFKNRNHKEQGIKTVDEYSAYKEEYISKSKNATVKYHHGDTIIKDGHRYNLPAYKSLEELNKDLPYLNISGCDAALKFKGTTTDYLFSYMHSVGLAMSDYTYTCLDKDGNTITEEVKGEKVNKTFKKTYYYSKTGTNKITITVPDSLYISGVSILSRKYIADSYHRDTDGKYRMKYRVAEAYNEDKLLSLKVNGHTLDGGKVSGVSPFSGVFVGKNSSIIDTSSTEGKDEAYIFRSAKWTFGTGGGKKIEIEIPAGTKFSSIELTIGYSNFFALGEKEEATNTYSLNAETTTIKSPLYYKGKFPFQKQRIGVFIYKDNRYSRGKFGDSPNKSNLLAL